MKVESPNPAPIRFQRLSGRGLKQPPLIGRFRHGQLVYVSFADGTLEWTRAVDETCESFEERILAALRELIGA
ncbi:hypothetical protein [Methylocystis echinoides]|uniref:hypothetical protein n=1 Tax=Methylocystis echinoides TaxID=29468 RepID=UPI00342D1C6B